MRGQRFRQLQTTRVLLHGRVKATCLVCMRVTSQRNSGLGRAAVATWESSHGGNCTA